MMEISEIDAREPISVVCSSFTHNGGASDMSPTVASSLPDRLSAELRNVVALRHEWFAVSGVGDGGPSPGKPWPEGRAPTPAIFPGIEM